MSQKTTTVINRDALVEAARQVRERAYAPYSKYKVGAALLTQDGSIITGCNVENAAYPACICAERVAITRAISEGKREFVAIAVVTSNGGTPCGICRQVMAEFAPSMPVIIADEKKIVAEYPVSDLLPHYFSPEDLV
ncbi:MAG: cytidine deaminase [Anaerolineae bacterium]|nr:cytidine deaminase [Anaerolineae bacterium]